MSENNNPLSLWNSVAKTDKRFIAPIKGGTYEAAKLSTVDATYIIRKATELWGPFGGAWGVRDPVWTDRHHGESNIPDRILLDATLFYPGGEQRYRAAWPYNVKMPDPEFCCMTHFIKKGLSRLGFCADVYMGKFEDDDRILSKTGEYVDPKVALERTLSKIKDAKTPEVLATLYETAAAAGFTSWHMAKINAAFETRKTELEATEVF